MFSNVIVMGSRTQCVDNAMPNGGYKRIVAFDSTTFEPATVRWSYEGDTVFFDADYFIDTEPSKYLLVTDQQGNVQRINRANFNSPGEGGILDYSILVALKDDMTLSPWGNKYTSGMYPEIPAVDNHGVKQIISGTESFLALREDGSIFGWGWSESGGVIPPDISQRSDINAAHTYGGAMVLGDNYPYIETWARQNPPPEAIVSMSDIKNAFINGNGGYILSTAGKVYCWSDLAEENNVPAYISELSDITQIYVNDGACVALRGNGQIVGWGLPEWGGIIPLDIQSLTDIDRVINGRRSFVALRKNGSVVAWGAASDGGSIPANILERSDIVDVSFCYGYDPAPQPMVSAYVAICADGSLCAWGGLEQIVNVPATTDVISVSCGYGTCCGLKKDGSVISWGLNIDQTPVEDLLHGVRAVYAGCTSFIALKDDKTIVVWGNIVEGGDMSQIPADIQGNVSYYL